jgi:serine/threonine protein kinase
MIVLCSTGEQMVDLLASVHRAGFAHRYTSSMFYHATLHRNIFSKRDIKPENFCVGVDDRASKLYLIDFGAATPLSTCSEPPDPLKPLVGSVRYISVRAHEGYRYGPGYFLENLSAKFFRLN